MREERTRVRPTRYAPGVGLLDDIIDGASSDAVTTTNLLRKVQTLAHRVDAATLRAWARAELDGYASGDLLPAYRGPFDASVQGVWSGPMGASARVGVSSIGVPDELSSLFKMDFRQGLAEIEQLSASGSDLSSPWDPYGVGRYNELIAAGVVPHMQWMSLASASRVVTPALLRGIVESVRTQALELALDLQAANASAGEVGGPTRQDPAVDRAVVMNINHIYGDGANVAQGSGITQTSTVTKGDVAGLAAALSKLLTDPKVIGEAIAIITGDDPEPEKRTKLQKVGDVIRRGSVSLAGGIASDVAADRLLELAGQFLGW